MDRRSTPRKKGDEFLMAAPDGWVHRDDLVRHVMQFVMPGQAHRAAAESRVSDHDPRLRDPLRVGSRRVANAVVLRAVRNGAYEREGDMLRHRDWQGAVAVASPEAGFTVPTMDEVRHHAALTGFTKWHWAAIVACYVVESEHGGDRSKAKNSLDPRDFAALGIAGLQSKDTVRQYLHNWMEHSGGVRPEPGEVVEIPSMDTWPTKRVRKREQTTPTPTPTRSKPWHQRLAETGDALEAASIIRKHTKIPDEIGRELVRGAKPARVTHLKSVKQTREETA